MYGCPIWIPYVTGNTLCTPWDNGELSEQQIASLFTKTPCEQLHLSFLKWNLGTRKRTSNCAIWGDTGRYPLIIKAIKQCIKYFDRLEDMHNSNNLVECAFAEQKQANLPWYNKMAKIFQYWQSDEDIKRSTANKIKKKMLLSFNVLWKNCCKSNNKLRFYNSIKSEIGPQIYLEMTQEPFESVKHLIRIRISSHLFHSETGRYLNLPAHERICRCCTDLENAQLLAVLPIPEVYIEYEEHILFSYQFIQNIRDQAHPHLKALLATNDSSKLFGDTNATTLLARYAKRIAKGFSDKTGCKCKRRTTRITRTTA